MSTKTATIKLKDSSIQWATITALLHEAYAVREQQGLRFVANTQSVERTIQRAAGGICLVAVVDGELAGTVTLVPKNDSRRGKYATLSQLGVLPKHRNQGIARQLIDEFEAICRRLDLSSYYADTAESAGDLIGWYEKLGWQKIGYCSHPETNYYSVVMRKSVVDAGYSPLYVKIRFGLSKMLCKRLKRADGRLTALGRSTKWMWQIVKPGRGS